MTIIWTEDASVAQLDEYDYDAWRAAYAASLAVYTNLLDLAKTNGRWSVREKFSADPLARSYFDVEDAKGQELIGVLRQTKEIRFNLYRTDTGLLVLQTAFHSFTNGMTTHHLDFHFNQSGYAERVVPAGFK